MKKARRKALELLKEEYLNSVQSHDYRVYFNLVEFYMAVFGITDKGMETTESRWYNEAKKKGIL